MGGIRVLLVLLLLATLGCATTGGGAAAGGAAAAPTSAAGAGGTTVVAIAPPAGPPHPNIWQFLGFDMLAADLAPKCQHMLLFLQGYFPAFAGPPQVLPIDDPANLESPNPSVKAAAAVAAEEAGAAQKAEAIKFLAKKGCGCYPDIHDALLAGLDDCVELVRFETARALYYAAGHPCQFCNRSSCCSPEVREALYRTAYDIDETGCYVEPSTRVRRAARLALNTCGGHCPPLGEDAPEEAPHLEPPPPAAPPAEAGPTLTGIDQRAPHESADPDDEAPLTRQNILVASRLQEARHHVVDDAPEPSETPTESEQTIHIVATVNGEPITDEEVQRGIRSRLGPLAEDLSEDDAVAVYRDELLWAIDIRLLTQDARNGDEGLHSAAFADSSNPPSRGAREVQARAILAERCRDAIEITHEQVLERYRRDADRFRLEPAVRWEQVTVPVGSESVRETARDLISGLRMRLLGGRQAVASRFDLARIQTTTVDWMELSQIKPAQLRNMLSRLSIGELSPIFEDPEGFHMVRLLERRGDRVLPLADVADTIRSELMREAQREVRDACLQTLRGQADIWTEEPLDAVEPERSPIQPAALESDAAAESEPGADLFSGVRIGAVARLPAARLNGDRPRPADTEPAGH